MWQKHLVAMCAILAGSLWLLAGNPRPPMAVVAVRKEMMQPSAGFAASRNDIASRRSRADHPARRR
jgi:hypothetical protein